MSNISTYHYPTTIHFGPGSSAIIDTHLKDQQIKKILLVSDRGVASLSFFTDLRKIFDRRFDVAVFHDFSPNPVSSEIDLETKKHFSNKPDLIIGIGGGASMDVAKALSVSIGHDEGILIFDEALGGDERIHSEKLIPVWAVPTTSGTGSEVGRSAVISDSETKQKKIIFHPKMMPARVFCDPELTLGLPSNITAQTGIDAFVHLFEAFCSPGFHPMADGIALEGMRLIEKSFIRAVNAPDIDARVDMMAAAMMGAVAFQKGLGVIHSCAHSLSACFDIHHGLANGVMLPYGAQMNLYSMEEKALTVARILGGGNASASDLPHLFFDLISEAGLPTNLGAFDIEEKDVSKLSTFAFQDGCHLTNPLKMSEEKFNELFKSAL